MTNRLSRLIRIAGVCLLPMAAFAAKLTFVMVPKGVHPYYEPCYEGFKAAAAKYGITVDKVDPQKFELPLQVKVIEDLIAQQVDGIAISALDDAGLVPVINEAMKAGIKVIERVPAEVVPSQYSERYLETKRDKMGHALPTDEILDTKVAEGRTV